MTAQEFRENNLLSSELAVLLRENSALRIALQVCDEAAPSNHGSAFNQQVFEQPHVAHIQLGIDRGYAMYGRILRELALPLEKPEPIEPTYEPEEKELTEV